MNSNPRIINLGKFPFGAFVIDVAVGGLVGWLSSFHILRDADS